MDLPPYWKYIKSHPGTELFSHKRTSFHTAFIHIVPLVSKCDLLRLDTSF